MVRWRNTAWREGYNREDFTVDIRVGIGIDIRGCGVMVPWYGMCIR